MGHPSWGHRHPERLLSELTPESDEAADGVGGRCPNLLGLRRESGAPQWLQLGGVGDLTAKLTGLPEGDHESEAGLPTPWPKMHLPKWLPQTRTAFGRGSPPADTGQRSHPGSPAPPEPRAWCSCDVV